MVSFFTSHPKLSCIRRLSKMQYYIVLRKASQSMQHNVVVLDASRKMLHFVVVLKALPF
jgi:hypothetical protein